MLCFLGLANATRPTCSVSGDTPMKLIITRPVVLTGAGGVRSLKPGLTVEVDAATAEQILERQAGIPAEPATPAEAPAPRRRKPTDAQT